MNKYDIGEALFIALAVITLIYQGLHFDPMSLAPSLIACTMSCMAIVFDNKSERYITYDTDKSNKSEMS